MSAVARVTRTVVVRSSRLPRDAYATLLELQVMYRDMLESLVPYAVGEEIKSFTALRAAKYNELRSMHTELPSHYAYTACQDAAARSKSFLRMRRRGRARGRARRSGGSRCGWTTTSGGRMG